MLKDSERFELADIEPDDRASYQALLRLRLSSARSTPLQKIAPGDAVRAFLATRLPRPAPRAAKLVRLTLATASIRDAGSLYRCAMAVSKLVAQAGNASVEWLIANDDPSLSNGDLLRRLPASVRACARITSPMPDARSAYALARIHGRFEWVIALEVDDLVSLRALKLTAFYAQNFPECSCIVGAVGEILASGDTPIFRSIELDAADLFRADPNALVIALRRDKLAELGALPMLPSGQEGYGYALRIAADEPILVVPDYLALRAMTDQPAPAGDAARRLLLRHLAVAEHATPKSPPERGICFTRTQGLRLDLLEEAVRSVVQQESMKSCVIVHGEEVARLAVETMLAERGLDAFVLHAPPVLGQKRGAPLNVGLDFLRAHADQYDVFCFLDDDDLFYPMHAQRLREAMCLSDGDIAVGMACAVQEGAEPSVDHPLMPTFGLVGGNIFPINAYLIRVDFALACGARFREDIHYLEDWDFLLQLYGAGARIQQLPEVLCGYRVIGDGNRTTKEDEAEFHRCWRLVARRGEACLRNLSRASMWRDLSLFDFDERFALSETAVTHMREAALLFLREGAG